MEPDNTEQESPKPKRKQSRTHDLIRATDESAKAEMFHFSSEALATLAGRTGLPISDDEKSEIALIFDVIHRRRKPVLKLIATEPDTISYQDLCFLHQKWEPLFDNLVTTRHNMQCIRSRDIIEIIQMELLKRLQNKEELSAVKTLELAKILQSIGYTIEKTEDTNMKIKLSEITANEAGDMNTRIASIIVNNPTMQKTIIQQIIQGQQGAAPPAQASPVTDVVTIRDEPPIIRIQSPDWGTDIGRPVKK